MAGFFLTLLFKMGPVYMDNMGVRSAMKSMATSSSDIADMSKQEVYTKLDSFFTINGIRDISVKDMEIIRRKDRTLINHVYERRVPIFYNVDVVMAFKNQIDSSNIQECCSYLIDEEGKPVNQK